MSLNSNSVKRTFNAMILKSLLQVVKDKNALYGKKNILNLCLGIPNNKFIDNQDINNPLYGLLEHVNKEYLSKLFDFALEKNLFEAIQYNKISYSFTYYELTDLGVAYLKDQYNVVYIDNKTYSYSLFQSIKKVMWTIIKANDFYSYMIPNKTIESICVNQPTTENEFLDINGVGPFFIENFYEAVSNTINNYRKSKV